MLQHRFQGGRGLSVPNDTREPGNTEQGLTFTPAGQDQEEQGYS